MVKKSLYIDGYDTGSAPEPTPSKYLRRNYFSTAWVWDDGIKLAHDKKTSVYAQTEYYLDYFPLDGYNVQMWINGIKQDLSDYTCSADGYVDYTGSVIIEATDNVEFYYQYLIASP